MKLKKARVQNYRSVHDTGWFEVEEDKTILVGPNEGGKTAVLRALQTVKMPPGEQPELDALRDYPRSRFGEVDPNRLSTLSNLAIASVVFTLDDDDREVLAEHAPHLAETVELQLLRHYNGKRYTFDGLSPWPRFRDVEKPLAVLRTALAKAGEGAQPVVMKLQGLTGSLKPSTTLRQLGTQLDEWLESAVSHLDLDNEKVDEAFDAVRAAARMDGQVADALEALDQHIPFFVYFSQYFKVRPRIHLGRLADQEAKGDIDEGYDFGNLCLLRLLGQSAAELADLGRGVPDVGTDAQGRVFRPPDDQIAKYQDRLDRRRYRLNASSIKLTQSIKEVWGEYRKVDIQADGQYLKVVVQNEDGAEVELDQGSEGFQWLVSFYVVFESQTQGPGDYSNAILLLDEPGLSLHALKQKQFRETVSKIAARNQTLFTTHSPFMVGSDEMDKVRIVEMKDRNTGTVVHEDFAVDDPCSLFPLQAHFGYELGQTLFGQHRNLIVEGITDYWYLQAIAEAARDAGGAALDENLTIVPAGDAGKVVYHATVLHAQDLRVAALFDSDTAGETAAQQETFVHLMKKKQIIMVANLYDGKVEKPEMEDLLRDTLLVVARDELGVDAVAKGAAQPKRPVCELLAEAASGSFSKYKLSKAFIRWMRNHGWVDLQPHEQDAMRKLFAAANKGIK